MSTQPIDDALERLRALIRSTRNDEELRLLLRGLLTPQEGEEIDLRWQLLCRLVDGETQRETARELGVSLGKIARGSRLLKYDEPELERLVQRLRGRASGE